MHSRTQDGGVQRIPSLAILQDPSCCSTRSRRPFREGRRAPGTLDGYLRIRRASSWALTERAAQQLEPHSAAEHIINDDVPPEEDARDGSPAILIFFSDFASAANFADTIS
jgi:hypothetical protein